MTKRVNKISKGEKSLNNTLVDTNVVPQIKMVIKAAACAHILLEFSIIY